MLRISSMLICVGASDPLGLIASAQALWFKHINSPATIAILLPGY
jgi:hypothetical protein